MYKAERITPNAATIAQGRAVEYAPSNAKNSPTNPFKPGNPTELSMTRVNTAAILGAELEGSQDTIWIHPRPQDSDAIVLDPANALPYSNRGVIYEERGQRDEAIAQYVKAAELDPDYSPPREALRRLGVPGY